MIDFESTLAAFPEQDAGACSVNGWGSDCHMMTVDKLFDLLPDGFLLVESDVLIKADIRQMWREGIPSRPTCSVSSGAISFRHGRHSAVCAT